MQKKIVQKLNEFNVLAVLLRWWCDWQWILPLLVFDTILASFGMLNRLQDLMMNVYGSGIWAHNIQW